MTEPGEMPWRPAERAVSERWIDELAALRVGGAVQRVPARGRLVTEWAPRRRGDRFRGLELLLAAVGAVLFRGLTPMPLIDAVFGRWTKPRRASIRSEVALYDPAAREGDLPRVVIDVPVRLADAIEAQGQQVDVRGVLGPGHGVVLVLDDGDVVPCQYPAEPPPPVGAKRIWAF